MDHRDQLQKQLSFVTNSCHLYDQGHHEEAIRLATSLRVIFHDTDKSTSILRHLGQKTISLLSTSTTIPSNNPSGYWPGLIQHSLDVERGTISSLPKFNGTPQSHRFLLFSTWWDDVIYWGGDKRIKRCRLILDAANKDGGAHVDASLPANYEWMVKGTDLSISIQRADGSQKQSWLSYPHLASLRQIAFEVLNSPELTNLATQP